MDPSQASINAIQPEQTETIICMDLKYYNAAAEGKIEVFKDVTDQSLHLLLTPIKNTILHIYITTLNSESKSTTTLNAGSESTTTPNAGSKSTTNFVKEILKMCPSLLWKTNAGLESTTTLNVGSESTTNFVEEILKMCPSLLQQTNAKDETLLHIAARYGHDDIVKFLLEYCAETLQDLEDGIEPVKKMLKLTNKEGDTALHEAVRYNHLKVVELLIREDPNFSYPANNTNETPLYIAVERGFQSVVFKILDECEPPLMHGGPLGRTALHAAIIAHNEGMTQIILDKIEGISRKVDNNGCTPFHLAAYFNNLKLVELLLNKDREVAYMKDTKGRTALHIAAQRGCVNAIIKYIVSRCPDCCELVDNRGWNVLHFAMKADVDWRLIKIIIENSSLSNLLNEKNADGDTPLHYYASSVNYASNFLNHPRVDKMAFNKQNLNVVDINTGSAPKWLVSKRLAIKKAIDSPPRRVITYEDEDKKNKLDEYKKKQKQEEEEILWKRAEAHLVVAALITTVTFAAGITMPGGFADSGEHPGSALLKRNAAFKAFVITNTISTVLSGSAVFFHLYIPGILSRKHRRSFLVMAFQLILWAMIAMFLAFITGTYAVLGPSCGLAIANCIIGLTLFFVIYILFHRKFVMYLKKENKDL